MSSNWKQQGAWVSVKWKPEAPKDAWTTWKSDAIKGLWSTTGNWDAKIWISASNADEIEKIIWDVIRKNQWVEKTETNWAWQLA